jgi:hypothetical protein
MINRQAILALLLMSTIGLIPLVRPTRGEPPTLSRKDAEPWMADVLPGIGPARRIAAAEALRAGRFESLPTKARGLAQSLFSPEIPPVDRSDHAP